MDPLTCVLLVAEDESERDMYFIGLAMEGFAVMCSGVDSDVTAAANHVPADPRWMIAGGALVTMERVRLLKYAAAQKRMTSRPGDE